MSLLDYLPWYGGVAAQASRQEPEASPERARPGERVFRPLESLSPVEAMVAADQQRTRATPQQGAPTNQSSFPWPTHSDGTPMPGVRGEVSLVPGVEPINVKSGGK